MAITSILQTLMGMCLLNTFSRGPINFGGHLFFLHTISIAKIQDDIIEKKLFYDFMMAPLFGMTMDPDRINLANIKNGRAGTPYLHVYVNFCNYGNKSRIKPATY
jgi:hypothetical protein